MPSGKLDMRIDRCPFCGERATVVYCYVNDTYGVWCNGGNRYGHGIFNYKSEQEAIDAWNGVELTGSCDAND